jgi:lipopolysaccharide heptosyltransferase II
MSEKPGKILVIRMSSIGDIILTTPLLRCLKKRYPETDITFVVKEQFAVLLSHSPYIDNLVPFSSKTGFAGLRSLKKKLRTEKYDLVIDIHKNLRSIYLRTFIGAGKVTGYSKQILRRTVLIWLRINLFKKIKPVFLRYFESVRNFDVAYDGAGTEITVPEAISSRVKGIVAKTGYVSGSGPLVILCPGATYLNKKWLPERFAETARILAGSGNTFIIVHGGKGDEQLCESIARQAGPKTINMAGKFDLLETAALLKSANLVIANDSGLLHLAQSQKTPVTGIYGATVRELGFFPMDGKSTVVEIPLYCRPCTHKGLDRCPEKHFRCMKDITTDSVTAAAMQLLNKRDG